MLNREKNYFSCSPDLFDELKTDKNIILENDITDEVEYFDTFDQLLYKNGMCLGFLSGKYLLEEISTGFLVTQFSSSHKLQFSSQIEDPDIRNIIYALMYVRRLLPFFQINRITSLYRLLNEKGETVLKLNYLKITSLKPQRRQPLILLQIIQIDHAEKKLQSIISKYHLKKLDLLENTLFEYLIRNFAIPLNDYSSQLNLKFFPEETALSGLKKILLALIPIIRANEQGILEDIDTEFLHDFRVAFRKTRSALSLIKDVLPAELHNTYKTRLTGIFKQTNHLRDLDVFLLQQDYYNSLLPPDLGISLQPFFLELKRLRALELQAVKELITSDTYDRVITGWQTALQQEFSSGPLPAKAKFPVLHLASKLINKRYQKIIKLGTAIHDHTQDEQLHRIRIQCKKLRYLINFFESLFPEALILLLLKKLKLFQNNLGEYNDYSFQINRLKGYLSNFPDNEETSRIRAALYVLIDILNDKKDLLKASMQNDFENFANEENQTLFKQLFSPGE